MNDNELNIGINFDNLHSVKKEYKKIKKYMRSSIYEAKKLSGEKTFVDRLIEKYSDDLKL
jgi:hypothetical protein